MAEINHRYLKDNEGEAFFPITHIDAVQGLENDSTITDINNKVVEINETLTKANATISAMQKQLDGVGKDVVNLTGDTGWIDYQVAPTYKKNQGVSGGFNCGIREIRVGTIVIKSIRLNLGKVNNNEQIAQLPIGFITKTQTFIARSNSNDNGVQFSVRDDGSVYGYLNKADQSLSRDRWVYQEFTWLE